MASNKNIPQKGQGANEPKKQPVQSDAADVDWMIISDISTRIGGSPDSKSGSNQSPVSSPSQVFSNQAAENDLEDLEWLRSLGLDEPIERATSPRNTSNTSNSEGSIAPSNNEVGDIDWLIVTDLKTRMDDSDIKAKANPSYQDIGQSQTTLQPKPDSLSFDEEDLGLDGLDFLDNSDFADLDSLGFDASTPLSIDGLQSEIDNTEGKIQGLAELLDDNDDSSFDLSTIENDSDWDSISGILEDNFNQPSSELSFDIVSGSSETSNQVSEVVGNTVEEFESIDLVSDQFAEINYSDGIDDLLVSDLDLSEEIQTEEIQFDQLVDDFEIQDNFPSEFQNELQNELQNSQDQDLPFDNFEVGNLGAEAANTLDDDFVASQYEASFNPNVIEDEMWSSNSSDLDSTPLDESVENTFTNDWGEVVENAIDDAVWDSPSSIDSDLILSTSSIDNAFGTSDDWASGSQVDLPEAEENIDFELANTLYEAEEYVDFELANATSEVEESIDFDLPNLESSEAEEPANFETANVDSRIEVVESLSFEPEFDLQTEAPFEQTFEQANNEPEDTGDNQNWGIELDPEGIDVNNIIADVSWEASPEDEINDEINFDIGLSDEASWSESLEAEIGIGNETDWSASLEAEISRGNDVWQEELVETEDYLTSSDQPSEIFNDDLLGAVDNNFPEQTLNEDFDFSNNLDEDDWRSLIMSTN